jgi:hypothetical protein
MRNDGRKVVRLFLASSLVALLTGALVPYAGAQTPPIELSFESPCSNIRENGNWGQIGLPNFGSGERRVQSYAVDAWNEKRMFVTNGFEIYRSMDGGCSWYLVYELPDQPSPENDYSSVDSSNK